MQASSSKAIGWDLSITTALTAALVAALIAVAGMAAWLFTYDSPAVDTHTAVRTVNTAAYPSPRAGWTAEARRLARRTPDTSTTASRRDRGPSRNGCCTSAPPVPPAFRHVAARLPIKWVLQAGFLTVYTG